MFGAVSFAAGAGDLTGICWQSMNSEIKHEKGEKGRAKGQEDVALGLNVAVLLLHNLKGSLKDGRLAIDEPACVEGAAAAVQCTPTTLKASPGPVTRRQLAAASQSQAAISLQRNVKKVAKKMAPKKMLLLG